MEMHFCKFCNKEHDDWYIRPDNGKRDCKLRRATHAARYRKQNWQRNKEYKKKWQQQRAEHLSVYQQKWRATSEKWNAYKPIKNIRQTKRSKERYSTELAYKMERKLRRRLWEAIKRDSGDTFSNSLGCSVGDLIKYLESKFYVHPNTKVMMTWENYGKCWHIDHIKALSTFDLSDKNQYKEACHYTNLQPLWVEDHIKKTKEDLHGKI